VSPWAFPGKARAEGARCKRAVWPDRAEPLLRQACALLREPTGESHVSMEAIADGLRGAQ